MSNEMFLGDTAFRISLAKEEAARAALAQEAKRVVEADGRRAADIRWKVEETGRPIEQLTFDELVNCWGWSLMRDSAGQTGEIIGIDLLEDSSGDEETLFRVLGPYVTAGSYITLDGNGTGGHWDTRYGFTGKCMVELGWSFPPVPIESDELPQCSSAGGNGMIIRALLEEKLTIDALGAHLHNLSAERIFASAEDELSTGINHSMSIWLTTNAVASYLLDVFPGQYIAVDVRAVYTSPVPLNPSDPLSTCQQILDLDEPEYTWLVLLLKMCDGIAAGSIYPVGITVAQVEAFLRLARDIDHGYVSH